MIAVGLWLALGLMFVQLVSVIVTTALLPEMRGVQIAGTMIAAAYGLAAYAVATVLP